MNFLPKNYIGIIVLLCIQLLLVCYTFPVQELLTNTPLFYIDNGYHWYTLKMHSHLLSSASSIIYDPYFNAGYPFGFFSDPSANVAKIINIILSGHFSEIQVWKIYVFFASVIAPFFPALGLLVLKFKPTQVIFGALLSLCLWWTGWFRWFETAGMISYVLGCFFSIFVVCVVLHVKDRITLLNTAIVGLLGAFMVLIHPLSVIPIFFVLSSFLLCNLDELKSVRKFCFFALFAILSVGLNYWWLVDIFSPAYGSGFSLVSYQSKVQPSVIFFEMLGIWGGESHGSKIYPLLLLLAGITFYVASKEQRRQWVLPFVIAWILLQLFSSLAGLLPAIARLTEPNRHAPVGYLFLIVPAVLCCVRFPTINELKSLDISILRKYFHTLLIMILSIICIREIVREISFSEHGRYGAIPPLVKSTGGYTDFVLETLRKNTDKSARVLFETSLGRIHDKGHLAGFYAYKSDREFIGGPYTYRYFAGFWDGFVFGKTIEEHSEAEFSEYLDLYNIGWVLAHSEASKKYFKKFNFLSPEFTYRELQFYKVNRNHSFFYRGTGNVTKTAPNLIQLDNLKGDEIVLKYHYVKGLEADEDVHIEPIMIANDPLPFIRIVNPPSKLVLSFN
jgi:hypothetical protein